MRHNPGTPTVFEARRASGVRKCSRCHEIKPFVEFYGRGSVCKPCTTEYHKEWRAAHLQEVKARQIEYGKANKETISAKSKARYLDNPQAAKDRSAKRYRAKRGEIREQAKDYYHRNESAFKQRAGARRALIELVTVGDPREIEAFYERVRTTNLLPCYWCKKIVRKKDRHVDHIIPLHRGGSHAVANLCCACRSCNLSKHAKMPDEFSGQGELHLA